MSAMLLVRRIVVCVLAAFALTLVVGASSALATSPWWHLTSGARPTNLKPGSSGQLLLTVSNVGDANVNGQAVPVRIADSLPKELKAVSISARTLEPGGGINTYYPLKCEVEKVSLASCTFEGTYETPAGITVPALLPPFNQIEVLVGVIVGKNASSAERNEVSVTGGEAPDAQISRPIRVGSTPAPFGVEEYELTNEEAGGALDTQAGSHPFQQTTTVMLNTATGTATSASSAALTKDLNFKWPPGLIGNPTLFQQCTMAQFFAEACPPASVVGVATTIVDEPGAVGILDLVVPLFNLEPSVGEAARFGFYPEKVPVFIDASVRTGEDYGITVHVDNVTQAVAFLSSEVTVWGVPGDPSHDSVRGYGCLLEAEGAKTHSPCRPLEQNDPPPFLTLPTSCTGPLSTSVVGDSWKEPKPEAEQQSFPGEPMPALDGCNRLPFSPSIKVTPDGTAASTPTGLTVDEHVPQESTLVAAGLAESDVKGLSVTLPEGVALNPSAADGLQACSLGQIGVQSPGPAVCPDQSKVATVKVKVPVLNNPLEGAAYLGMQSENPFGSLIALYIYAEDPVSGVRVKATGEVLENPVTGQLTAHFEHDPLFDASPETSRFLPQAPFEDVEVHFFGGERAPLATPALCGSYTTTGTFTPWSGGETTGSSSTFAIDTGPNHAPCQNPLPFEPSLTAGTTSIQAGGFSPFTMTMSREDGQQALQAISLHMPPGLSGLLAGVELCPEPQADEGLCGPSSLIGETTVSVGLGGDPFSVKGGRVYITGPYRGAPFGLSIVNPAKAGPFDLEKTPANHPACDCVVVRAKIEVDPVTAQLTVTSDDEGPYKIPTIIEGIPLQIKHVNVTINRPGFTFNPTDCDPLKITGSLHSTQGATAALSVPLQVTNCAVLGFKPQFSVSTSGKTSRKNGASLNVKLVYPKAAFGSQANIRSVKVNLPKQLPSRLTTLQKACTDSTFNANPAGCPAASRVGSANATTPLLPVPLSGPAYFVSHGGAKFPELIVVLQGYGVTVDLHGETFISKAGITSSTFRTVPDVPVGSFELTLPEGSNSALAANGNFCSLTKTVLVKRKVTVRSKGRTRTVTRNVKTTVPASLLMPTAFTAQNGAVLKQNTVISVTGCPKVKKKVKKKK